MSAKSATVLLAAAILGLLDLQDDAYPTRARILRRSQRWSTGFMPEVIKLPNGPSGEPLFSPEFWALVARAADELSNMTAINVT